MSWFRRWYESGKVRTVADYAIQLRLVQDCLEDIHTSAYGVRLVPPFKAKLDEFLEPASVDVHHPCVGPEIPNDRTEILSSLDPFFIGRVLYGAHGVVDKADVGIFRANLDTLVRLVQLVGFLPGDCFRQLHRVLILYLLGCGFGWHQE